MTAQTFPLRTLNARKLARLADELVPMLPVVARPGHCICGHRLSVANTSGVCDSCVDEKARLIWAKQHAAELKALCVCGHGPKVYRGLCAECNRAYTREYRRRQRDALYVA